MSTEHVKIIGRVQGIGYRRWAADVATKMKLSGWVRNTADGAVEIMVKGEQERVNAFLKECLKGPLFATVLGIQPVGVPQNAPVPIEDGVFKIVAST